MSRVPVIHYNERLASQAFAAYTALLCAERSDPSLRDNPAWTILKREAYEGFEMAFAKVGQ